MGSISFTDRGLKALKAKALKEKLGQKDFYDAEEKRLVFRVNRAGTMSFRVMFKNRDGKITGRHIGRYPDEVSLKQARDLAHDIKREERVKRESPLPELMLTGSNTPQQIVQEKTFKVVAEEYFADQVKGKYRSESQIRYYLEKALYPVWETVPFHQINRGEIMRVLRDAKSGRGPRAADVMLAIISKCAKSYALQDDDYTSPIIRGMRQTDLVESTRDRQLDDDEIRAFWKACGELGTFGALARVLLLTGQRRSKVATMRWSDLKKGIWFIPSESKKEKANAKILKLPKLALEVIEQQPRLQNNPFVFGVSQATRRNRPGKDLGSYSAFGAGKEKLDLLIAETLPNIPDWTLHDLRRTARTLMPRAGILPDIAERVLGHALLGVRKTYDKYHYNPEKAEALKKLNDFIGLILIDKAPAAHGLDDQIAA